jgi:hypothetical protein
MAVLSTKEDDLLRAALNNVAGANRRVKRMQRKIKEYLHASEDREKLKHNATVERGE